VRISSTPVGAADEVVPDRVTTTADVMVLHDALLASFAERDAVVCDLTRTVVDGDLAELAGALVGVAARVADWPAAVLMLVVPQQALREHLLVHTHPRSLVVVGDAAAGPPTPAATDLQRRRRLLEPVLRAAALARQFLRETLDGWPADGYRDDALVVVDELVANAVLHAGTEIELRLALQPDRLGVAVADRSPGRPSPGRPGDAAESGRGLMLVDALARSWHVLPRPGGGKVVRAVLVADVPRGSVAGTPATGGTAARRGPAA
jgi:anti-sigma regulatory factor (Ser/Thr protein kinase)